MFHEEIVRLKKIFRRNSYSEKFVDRCILYYVWMYRCNFLNKVHVLKVVELTLTKKELILVLSYFGQQSFEIQNRIQCCLRKNTPVSNLKVIFQLRKRLSTLFSIKDKIIKMPHSSLVYKFKCSI